MTHLASLRTVLVVNRWSLVVFALLAFKEALAALHCAHSPLTLRRRVDRLR